MLLIAFEGIDGAGKTTLINEVAAGLKAEKYPVKILEGLGSSTIGTDIRQMFLTTTHLNALTKYHLSLAALKQIQAEILRPLSQTNTIVLMDRYIASNYAYQANAAYLSDYNFDYENQYIASYNYVPASKKEVDHFLNRFRMETDFLPVPDFTFYLDIKVDFAKKRFKNASDDVIETADTNYFSLVQTHYEEYFAANYQATNLLFLKGINAVLENYHTVTAIIKKLMNAKGN